MAAIHKQMVAIMKEVPSIAKGRKNTQQNYQFRGVDDVYQALQQIVAKNGVYTTSDILSDTSEERQTKSGATLIYRILKIKFTFHSAEDDSSVDSVVIGEGMDSGDKASNKAMSVAHKYVLLQAFMVPSEDAKDPENDSHQIEAKPKPQIDNAVVDTISQITDIEELGNLWNSLTPQQRGAHKGFFTSRKAMIVEKNGKELVHA